MSGTRITLRFSNMLHFGKKNREVWRTRLENHPTHFFGDLVKLLLFALLSLQHRSCRRFSPFSPDVFPLGEHLHHAEATFNIQNYGVSKASKSAVLEALAVTIRRCLELFAEGGRLVWLVWGSGVCALCTLASQLQNKLKRMGFHGK